MSNEDIYVIDHIMNRRTVDGKKQVFVLWKGFPIEDATWEPEENFSKAIIEEYEVKKRAEDEIKRKNEEKIEAERKKLATTVLRVISCRKAVDLNEPEFLVRFEDLHCGFLSNKDMKKKFPEILIDFYENNADPTPAQLITKAERKALIREERKKHKSLDSLSKFKKRHRKDEKDRRKDEKRKRKLENESRRREHKDKKRVDGKKKKDKSRS